MALQFQPPNFGPAKTAEEGLAAGLAPAIQQLPSLLFQYKQFKQQQELADQEFNLKKQQFQRQFGTGAPAPTQDVFQPSMGPGSTLAASPKLDPMASSISIPKQETEEDKLTRLGTERYRLLQEQDEQKGVSSEKQFTQLSQLRGQFFDQTKDFGKIRDSYTRVVRSTEDPSAAGDLALIFNYMKILDPGSVVRESEFANAQNAGGVEDRIRATYNKVLRGERLSTDQRKDFFDRAQRLYQGQEKIYKGQVNEFRRLAQSFDLDPDLAVIDMLSNVDTGPTAAPTTPVAVNPPQVFNSEAEAEKANLPVGTIITIGGRRAVIE